VEQSAVRDSSQTLEQLRLTLHWRRLYLFMYSLHPSIHHSFIHSVELCSPAVTENTVMSALKDCGLDHMLCETVRSWDDDKMTLGIGHREVVPPKSSMLLVLQRHNLKDHKRLSWWTKLWWHDVICVIVACRCSHLGHRTLLFVHNITLSSLSS